LICGGFVGVGKLERFLLLKAIPLIKGSSINIREPENISKEKQSDKTKKLKSIRGEKEVQENLTFTYDSVRIEKIKRRFWHANL
jgi:hypothetical protein